MNNRELWGIGKEKYVMNKKFAKLMFGSIAGRSAISARIAMKRCLALLLAASLVFTVLEVPVQASDTLRYTGEAALGENQPIQHGYRQYDLLSWTPETDMYSESMRASVPLQSRIATYAPTQANPDLSDKTSFFNLAGDYGNSWFESTAYTNEFSQYAYNFWQYTDYYSYWHGIPTWDYLEFDVYDEVNRIHCGTLNIPNPAYTNAAHKNGTLSLACLFVGEASRSGETINTFKMRDENGIPVVAQKIVELARYYGFDGVFINDEELHSNGNADMQAATRYLVENGLYVQWYNASASISGSTVSNLKDSQGRINANSWFLDYGWNSGRNGTVSAVKNAGLDPLNTVFFGYEAGGARWSGSVKGTSNDLSPLKDSSGKFIASFAMLGTDFVHHGLDEDNGNSNGSNNRRAQDPYQWLTFDRERIWFSGWNMDPTTAGDMSGVSSKQYATGKTSSSMQGIAYAVSERSVIDGRVFYTNFSTGHGLQYFSDGQMSNDSEWSNLNMQSILPTWQWWVDVEENASRLGVDFDYGTKYTRLYYDGTSNPILYEQLGGYNGGNSLVINGKLDGRNFIHLYKTELDLVAGSKLKLVYNKPSEDDNSSMKLGIIFKDGTTDRTEIAIEGANQKTNGWQTATVDLTAYAGKTIAALGLVFDTQNAIDGYQMNIGEITVTDGENYTPSAPTGFKADKLLTTGEACVSWDMASYDTVNQYNVYAKMKDGSVVSLGGLYHDSYYIKKLDTENLSELWLRAVGIDGTLSEAAVVDCSKASLLPGLTVTQARDNTVKATFTNNTGEALKAALTIEYQQQTKVYTKQVDEVIGEIEFSIDELDGFYYTLSLETSGGKTLTAVRGTLEDQVCAPYDGAPLYLNEEMTSAEIPYPGVRDWKYITISVNGVAKVNRLLKYDNSNKYHNKKTLTGLVIGDTISVVLEDFNGNISAPAEFIVDETPHMMEPRKGTFYLGDSVQLGASEKVGEIREPRDPSLYTWELSGSYAAGTGISETGLLTIAPTEKAATIVVTATLRSDTDISMKGSFAVENPIKLSVSGKIYKGQPVPVSISYKGEEADAKDYGWSVTGASKAGTAVADDGTLSVDLGETASSLVVTAALKANEELKNSVTVSSLTDAFILSVSSNSFSTGGTLQASLTKFGEAADGSEMDWYVDGAQSAQTTIDENGLLTVAEDEASTALTIRAVYKNDSSIILTATVNGVPKIQDLTATVDGTSQIIVSWSPAATATGYDLMADGTLVSNVTAPYVHKNLELGSTHTYQVRAKNTYGTGEWSAVVSATIAVDVSGAYFPDPVLLGWVQDNIGTTLDKVVEHTGEVDLSGLAVTDLTGLNLFREATSILLKNTKITILDQNMLPRKITGIDLTDCKELRYIRERAFTDAGSLKSVDITGCSGLRLLSLKDSAVDNLIYGEKTAFPDLIVLDLSNTPLNLKAGSPVRDFAEQIRTQVKEGQMISFPDAGVISTVKDGKPFISGTFTNPANMFDGNVTGSYGTCAAGGGEVILDFGKDAEFKGFQFYAYNSSYYIPKSFNVYYSADGAAYTQIGSSVANNSSAVYAVSFAAPVTGRYFKLEVLAQTYAPRFYELQVMGIADTDYVSSVKFNGSDALASTAFAPANGAAAAPLAEPLRITFADNAVKGTGDITIYNAADDTVFQTIPVSSELVSISGDTATIAHDKFDTSRSYYILIDAGTFTDFEGVQYPGITVKTAWAFTAAKIFLKVDLTAYFNTDGFSYDTNRADGNVDDAGYSFPAELAQAASPVSNDGVGYQFGSFADGDRNVISSTGQTIDLDDKEYVAIGILASAMNGDQAGTFTFHYSDSTTSAATITARDWCASASSHAVALNMAHRHSATKDDSTSCRIYRYYLTPEAGKTVTGITLPNNTNFKIMAASLVLTDEPTVVPVTGVELTTNKVALTVSGSAITLSAVITPEDATDKRIIWSTSDENVATVSEDGLVTPVSAGTAIITAITVDGGFTAVCEVTVTNEIPAIIPVTGVALNTNKLVLTVSGSAIALSAAVTPENATNKEIIWSTSDENVATVSEDGLVTPVSAGTAIITATTVDGGFTAICEVTVRATDTKVKVTGITVSGRYGVTRVAVGNTLQLEAVVLPEDAEDKSVTWSVIGGTGTAVISNTGLLRATGEGKVTVRAMANDGSGIIGEVRISIYRPSVIPDPTPIPTPIPEPTPTPEPAPEVDENGNLTVKVTLDKEGIDSDHRFLITATEELLKQIENPEVKRLTLEITEDRGLAPDSFILTAQLLEAARKEKKSLTALIRDEEGKEAYSWTFDRDMLEASEREAADIDLKVRVTAVKDHKEIYKKLGESVSASGMVFSFAHDGVLPVQGRVRLYVGDQAGIGKDSKIYLYHYNYTEEKLETVPYNTYTVDENGYVAIDIVSCGDYAALAKAAPASHIKSLRNQITVTVDKKTITLKKSKEAKIEVRLPATLTRVSLLKEAPDAGAVRGVTITYTSSNKKIARVDKNGVITGLKAGKAVITTKITLYSGKTRSVKTTVTIK